MDSSETAAQGKGQMWSPREADDAQPWPRGFFTDFRELVGGGPHLDSPAAGGAASVRKRWHWRRYSRHFCTVSERDTVAPCGAGEGRNGGPLGAVDLSSTLPHTHTLCFSQGPWSPKPHQARASRRGGENKLGPLQRAAGECFHTFTPPRGPAHSLTGSSAQQTSTDLVLLRGEDVRGRVGCVPSSWSRLTSPRREFPRALSFVMATGSFPRAPSACLENSHTVNHST